MSPNVTRRLLTALPWIALIATGLGLRLIAIDNRPLDAHHVRQSDTSSIARVMAREGVDLLHPRIAWAGEGAGTVESELPLYAAMVAVGWRVAGEGPGAYTWPRSLSVLWWLAGGVALALWARRRLAGPVWPALLLYTLSPLAVVFSRNVQPDAMGVALMLWAMLAADRSRDVRAPAALLGLVFAAAALLGLSVVAAGKAVFWAPLVPALVALRPDRWRVPAAALLVAVTAGLSAAWFWHARVHLGAEGATFGFWGRDAHKWGAPALWLDVATWRYVIGTLVVHTLTPAGALLCVAGAVLARRDRELVVFAAGMALGGLAMLVATAGFGLHDYYQLSLVPFASVLAGAALAAGWRGRGERPVLAALALAGAVALVSVPLGARFVSRSLAPDARVARVVVEVGTVMPVQQSLVVLDRHPQTILYGLDRRGWHRAAADAAELRRLREYGADFLLITDTSPSHGDPALAEWVGGRWPAVARGNGWDLYRLR